MADELLTALGRIERERRDRAHDEAATGDAEAARVLLRPLADDEQADLLARVMGRLAAPASEATTRAADAADTLTADEATRSAAPLAANGETASAARLTASEPAGAAPLASTANADAGKVVLLAPRRRGRWFAGLGSLAAAAAVLLVVMRPGSEVVNDLPEYALVRGGGDASSRSGGETPAGSRISLRSDSAVDLVLAPGLATAGPLVVRLIAVSGDETRWLDPSSAEVSADGAIRLRGARAWGLAPGRWDLTVLIARPERAPADLDAYRRDLADADARGWRRVRLELEVVDAR